ncbi:MAG TPA: BamA/TamA family outer membrane protein [Gemmatimonadales bacterium]|nr:BamA/TamA family outer membrane protein [Gemmatimonadales bacterium]
MSRNRAARAAGAAGAAATIAVALLAAAPRAARAQVPPEPWSFVMFPVPTYSSLEGLGATLVGGWWKSAPPGPIPSGAAINPGASISTSGTETLSLTYNNTGRTPGWRFLLIGGYERFRRAPYFGLGNFSRVSDSLEAANGGDSHYYRYSLTRTTALVGIQRRVTGPVRVLVGAQYRRYRAVPLGGAPTALGADLASGAASDTGNATGLEVRGALLFDTRDEEASPSRGLFVEAIGARALKGAGDFDYTRWAFDANEFFPVHPEVVLAFRQAVQLAQGAIPFYVAYERLTSWLPTDGFGGISTLRQNIQGRWLGPNTALASVDLRYKYWDAALGLSPYRLWLVAHADVGRVWDQGERFQWTGLHTGYGVGAIAQLGRASCFGLEVGWSPDAHLQFGTTVTLGY